MDGINGSTSGFWEQIERSESYLVCSMYAEAAALAASVLERICKNDAVVEEEEARDMTESAAMVFVQSLHRLGRMSEIMNELTRLFASAAQIPVQVLLIGACFQISENVSSGVRKVLEEFLSKWICVDERYYVLVGAQADLDGETDFGRKQILRVEEYMEVVEVYAFTLLGMSLKEWELAISWVENASLPEELRQGLLRRLHSLCSSKTTNTLSDSLGLVAKDLEACHSLHMEPKVSNQSPVLLRHDYLPDGDHDKKQEILKLFTRNHCLWWFPSVTLKFGGTRFVVTNVKIFLGCLILLVCYILRRKQTTLNGIVRRQVISIKKALTDLWHLPFSYQLNPLAAVQTLPAATRRQ